MKYPVALLLLTIMFTSCSKQPHIEEVNTLIPHKVSSNAVETVKITTSSSSASSITTQASSNSSVAKKLPQESFTTTTTFAELVALRKNIRCKFDYIENAQSKSGTSWIDGSTQNISLELFTQIPKTNTPLNIIVKDGKNYIWGGNLPEGIAIEKPNNQLFGEIKIGEFKQAIISNTVMAYFDCQPWEVLPVIYQPPPAFNTSKTSNILEAVLQFTSTNIDENGEQTLTIDCEVCKLVNEQEQEACRKALNC